MERSLSRATILKTFTSGSELLPSPLTQVVLGKPDPTVKKCACMRQAPENSKSRGTWDVFLGVRACPSLIPRPRAAHSTQTGMQQAAWHTLMKRVLRKKKNRTLFVSLLLSVIISYIRLFKWGCRMRHGCVTV